VTARLGERLGGPGCGWVAALLLAVAPLHVRESHYGSMDAPAVFFFTAALLYALDSASSDRLRSAATGGAFTGLAAAHRYQLGIVALAYPIAEALRRPADPGGSVRRVATAGSTALAVFLVLTPQVIFHFQATWNDVAGAMGQVYGWKGPRSLTAFELFPLAMGALTCILATAGIAVSLRRGWRATLPVLVIGALYALSVFQSQRVFARYTLPLLPLIAAFASAAICAIATLLPGRAAAVGLALIVGVAAAGPARRSVEIDVLLGRDDTRWLSRAWLSENLPDDAKVSVAGGIFYTMSALPGTGGSHSHDSPPDPSLDVQGANGRTPPETLSGRYLVTMEHPGLPMFGLVPDDLERFLHSRAELLVEFRGTDLRDGATLGTYDPTDANYLPLAGFTAVQRPGPNIQIWKVP